MADELLDCKRRVAELEIENDELRAASESFGDLAERLNEELEHERRSGFERRVALRPTADRRRSRASRSEGTQAEA
jgi:hypothetical protein